MSRNSQEATSLVRAVQHGHVPVEAEVSESVFESVLLSNDAAARATQRKALGLIIEEIDDAVHRIDVISFYLSCLNLAG